MQGTFLLTHLLYLAIVKIIKHQFEYVIMEIISQFKSIVSQLECKN
jgi:hypothetical protein